MFMSVRASRVFLQLCPACRGLFWQDHPAKTQDLIYTILDKKKKKSDLLQNWITDTVFSHPQTAMRPHEIIWSKPQTVKHQIVCVWVVSVCWKSPPSGHPGLCWIMIIQCLSISNICFHTIKEYLMTRGWDWTINYHSLSKLSKTLHIVAWGKISKSKRDACS